MSWFSSREQIRSHFLRTPRPPIVCPEGEKLRVRLLILVGLIASMVVGWPQIWLQWQLHSGSPGTDERPSRRRLWNAYNAPLITRPMLPKPSIDWSSHCGDRVTWIALHRTWNAPHKLGWSKADIERCSAC